jgi:hypothetical protein
MSLENNQQLQMLMEILFQDFSERIDKQMDVKLAQLATKHDIDTQIDFKMKNFATKEDLSTHVNSIKKDLKHLETEITTINHQMNELKPFLGNYFEDFNASWIKFYFEEKYPGISIQLRKKFDDIEMKVNPGSNYFEVDIYSSNPHIVVETTTYLKEDEFSKVEKLIRIKEFFQAKGNPIEKMFFITYDIYDSITKKVEKFCSENGIKLIKKINLDQNLKLQNL